MIRGYGDASFHNHRMSPFSIIQARRQDYSHGIQFDPHHYTSGRWLHNDQNERQMRYIEFDFDALCVGIVALCPGAGSISDCDKIEGGFDRVFISTLDNSQRIVARLPFTLAGPSHITTSSEVAAIKYCELEQFPLGIAMLANQSTLIKHDLTRDHVRCLGQPFGQYCDGLVDAGVCRIPPKDSSAGPLIMVPFKRTWSFSSTAGLYSSKCLQTLRFKRLQRQRRSIPIYTNEIYLCRKPTRQKYQASLIGSLLASNWRSGMWTKYRILLFLMIRKMISARRLLMLALTFPLQNYRVLG